MVMNGEVGKFTFMKSASLAKQNSAFKWSEWECIRNKFTAVTL